MATETRKVRLSSGESLQAFLTKVIDEGVKSALSQQAITEKEKQATLAGTGTTATHDDEHEDDDIFGDSTATGEEGGGSDDNHGADQSGGDEEAAPPSKTMDDETEKLKRGDVKVKDVVEKLNSIRSGKSFKDSAVSQPMEQYIGSLSKTERVALFAFLKGIAQIVTGEVPAKDASDPRDAPSDVKMQKGDKKDVRHVRPNVIKGSASGGQEPGQQKKPSQEDTTAPAPIVPKKR